MKKVKSKYVVRYIDDFRDNIYNYLVMEYCDCNCINIYISW